MKLTEENIRERYPWDYGTLSAKCRQLYSDFKENQHYHKIRKRLAMDARFGHVRYLDPANTKSNGRTFFNPNILREFDKIYTRKDDE